MSDVWRSQGLAGGVSASGVSQTESCWLYACAPVSASQSRFAFLFLSLSASTVGLWCVSVSRCLFSLYLCRASDRAGPHDPRSAALTTTLPVAYAIDQQHVPIIPFLLVAVVVVLNDGVQKRGKDDIGVFIASVDTNTCTTETRIKESAGGVDTAGMLVR